MLSVVNDDGTTADGPSLIDKIVREGTGRMLGAALEAEVKADEHGRRLVVRNGVTDFDADAT